MKRMYFLGATLLVAMLSSTQLYGSELAQFFQSTDAFMRTYVSDGAVDYAGIKANGTTINQLHQQVANIRLTGATAAQKKAFYINAYNILVIHSIVQRYPVGSPMDIQGFFDSKKHDVAGDALTLNELEQQKLLRVYEDARIHFVVVCAAKGCPTLASFAYVPEKLEQQLDAQTKKALNSTYFIRPGQGQVAVSKIFEWYQGDFTKGGQTVLGYINQYRTQKLPAAATVTHYEYDWALNQQ